MSILLRPTLTHAASGGIGLALGLIVGAFGSTTGTSDKSLRNDIALQILRGGGNLNEIKQKVDYLCKAGFIDAEKSSWRRRWLDTSNPCDNPGGK
jgi:hypothetical protein